MASSIEITAELMAGFLDEAPEYLDMLDAGLMEFESKAGSGVLSLDDPDDQERMTTMFRAAHSLKGLAAAFGFDKIKELTHRMETLFDQVRMGKRGLAAASFETLFRVFDRLKALIAELADEGVEPVEIDDILRELDAILEEGTPQSEAKAPSEADTSVSDSPKEASVVSSATTELFSDPELSAVFVETTCEALDELNQGLLGLEENPGDIELLNQVFRCAHNIKGASGAAGLSGMNRLTHNMETIFDQMRAGRLQLNDEIMNAVFQAVDRLRVAVDSMRDGLIEDVPMAELQGLFEPWTTQEASATASSDSSSGMGSTAEVPARKDGAEGSPEGESSQRVDELDLDGMLVVELTFPEGFAEAPIQAYLIFNKLSELGTVVSSEPDVDSLDGDSDLMNLKFIIETTAEPKEIQEIISTYGVERVKVSGGGGGEAASPSPTSKKEIDTSAKPLEKSVAQPVENGSPKATAPQPDPVSKSTQTAARTAPNSGKPERPATKANETLRVDQERLDYLMNLGGELIINRARFIQVHGKFRELFSGKSLGYLVDDITDRLTQAARVAEELREENGSVSQVDEIGSHLTQLGESFRPIQGLVRQVHDLRTSMYDFDEALHSLTRVSDAIQKGIMSTRMVPVGPLFTRFRRVVRDITKANGKNVNLVLKGEHTELDKRMIDELGDPLTHMIRNSVDHGIETPEVRKAAGKNPTGTLTLEAVHRGNSICIEVTDDGAGINLERVRAKIIEREMATPAQVENMSNKELVQYVFKPGFSTAETITDVSGRGMGMDIVMNKLEKLNGTVDIDSTPGQGTKVVIKLPLTLAILTSLVAKIGRGVYALPLETVAEIIKVRRDEVRFIQGRKVVCVRDRVVPLAWFEDVFRTSLPGLKTSSSDKGELTVVIVGTETDRMGLVVDELLGQEDVVIKSIAENYCNVRGIAGASIRGDGSVSLILDIEAMADLAAKAAEEKHSAGARGADKIGAVAMVGVEA